jgi:uncharacterized protein YfaS (alpha-2-macroglobulin family)
MSRLAFTALFAAAALAACNKAPPPPAPPAPPVAPAAVAPPAAPEPAKQALSVTGADLGTELGADGRIVTAKEVFSGTDTIIVAITTTNTGAAPANAQLTARWLNPDGSVLNEESRQQDFSGTATVSFRIADPKGLKPGKYKLEVALNGSTVQTREFSVN